MTRRTANIVHHVGLDANGAVRVTAKPRAPINTKPRAPGKPISLYAAMKDVRLLGGPFQAPSFWTWFVIAKLFSGEKLDEREAELFRKCTGRTKLPDGPIKTLIFLSGRRSGKDRFQSALAVWLAALAADWKQILSAGEDAVVILLGSDFKQARILRRYCQGLIETPMLAALVTRATETRVEFRNGAVLEIATNDASLVRGRSAIGVICTETSFWSTDGSNSDEEVISAATPSMAMIPPPGGILMASSSVHRKAGYMYSQWKSLHGNDESEDICWLSPSAAMNSMIPPKVIEAAIRKDPMRAKADYLSEWRDDISDFLPMDVLESATDFGVTERAPLPNTQYIAFYDGAGGTGKDSSTICIAHREDNGVVVIDFLRERLPRFVPAEVVKEFAAVCRLYKISKVIGDRYSAGWNADEWKRVGMQYMPSEQTKSELFLSALPMFLSGQVRLVDHLKMRQQFVSLERRVHTNGRESVGDSGAASAHDDLANCLAGAMVLASVEKPPMFFAPPFVVSQARFWPGDSSPTQRPGGEPLLPSSDQRNGA
jgi:hypothetical protein